MTARQKTALLVVHVTATAPSADIGAKEIDRMHKARGWKGIGYHFVIRRDGTVEKGRAEGQIGAHVAGWNSVSLGIALVGGVDAAGRPRDNRTPAQSAALESLLRRLLKKYPGARICGHRDLSPDRDGDGVIEPFEHLKACPCFDAIPWAQARGLPAANIRGTWDKAPDERTAWLQKLLRRAGYEFGPVDGIVGPKTRAAIKRFQAAAGFDQTGEFDERTVKRLRDMAEPRAAVVDKIGQAEPLPAPAEKTEPVAKSKRFWTWLVTGIGAPLAALGNLHPAAQIAIVVGIAGFAVYAITSMPAVRKKLGLA